MQTVLIVIHLIIVIALVGTILLQRSEGGALGIGGGGGGMLSARGSANFLTRLTAILAVIFFVTSLGLTLVARFEDRGSLIDTLQSQTSDGSGASLFDSIEGSTPAGDTNAPASDATTTVNEGDANALTNPSDPNAEIDSLLQSLDAPAQTETPTNGEDLLDALNQTLGTDVTNTEVAAPDAAPTAGTEDTSTPAGLEDFTEALEQGVSQDAPDAEGTSQQPAN